MIRIFSLEQTRNGDGGEKKGIAVKLNFPAGSAEAIN